MKIVKTFTILICLAFASLVMADHPMHNHKMSPEMKKQHETMTTINKQWSIIQKSLNSSDIEAAEKAAGNILEKCSNIEKFMLHKNGDKKEEFLVKYKSFEGNISKLHEAIKLKDLDTAKGLLKPVDNSCKECHSMFR
ncbi:MAG: cytochrome c [Nitrospirae bacterium]|nr:cytochrome c [Nitrospirota bacterium]